MPCEFVALIVAFAPLFSKPVFQHAQVLLMGAILAPGRRTVTACHFVCRSAATRASVGNRFPFLRGRPICPSRLAGAGSYNSEGGR